MNEEEGADYINANYIPVSKTKVKQAPKFQSRQRTTTRETGIWQTVQKKAILLLENSLHFSISE